MFLSAFIFDQGLAVESKFRWYIKQVFGSRKLLLASAFENRRCCFESTEYPSL